jgi:hypothetical protein
LQNGTPSAASAAAVSVSGAGRRITSTPAKPNPTALQRSGPTCSRSTSALSATTTSGARKPVAVTAASCMRLTAKKNSSVASARKPARSSCTPGRAERSRAIAPGRARNGSSTARLKK